MRTLTYFSIAVFLSFLSSVTMAEQLLWTWQADESQVKNYAPNAVDGSTDSLATGSGFVRYDTQTNIITLEYNWNELFGELTKLHIHGPATANMSTPQHIIETFGPPDLPGSLDLHSDTWTDSFELQTLVQPGFADLSPQQIIQIMEDGLAYVNIHSSVFGMGEIRGNLGLPTVVPEPGSVLLVLVFLFGCGIGRSPRRNS